MALGGTRMPISFSTELPISGGPNLAQKAPIFIINSSLSEASIYYYQNNNSWVNSINLNPGQSANTLVANNIFKIVTKNYTEYFTQPQYGIIQISDSELSFKSFPEIVYDTKNGIFDTYYGYGIIDAAKSLGVSISENLPVSSLNNSSNLNMIKAPSAWAAGITGKGITVAVLDGGLAKNTEYSNNIVNSYNVSTGNSDTSIDLNFYPYHGTGIAGIIAGSHSIIAGQDVIGVAPDVSLLDVKITNTGSGTTDDLTSKGIRWAVDHGANVISISQQSDRINTNTAVPDSIKYAFDHNVVVVICASNQSGYGPSGYSYSASYGTCIAVGNIDLSGGLFADSNKAGFTPLNFVDAPSVGYQPTSQGTYVYTGNGGTSFATPYVSGLAALIFQKYPGISAAEVIQKIISSASVPGFNPATATYAVLGTSGADALIADHASNYIMPGAGNDSVAGGSGNDVIIESSGDNYIRGNDGNDSITGGAAFDDINGNQGNDTALGNAGEDWVVGGKDNDSLSGGADYDLVYGNLGNDTCNGDDGNDIVRGGQGNDIVNGGAGNDYVSGDKGDDTMTGGAGADIFHSFGDAGIDRVTDFSLSQGDRVQLDPGTVFTLSQVGADTVINMTGGGQMTLVGVQLSTLPTGWIFGA